MKKRLLSAALALAMVLTMLPLTALPAFAASSGDDAYYHVKDKAFSNASENNTLTASEDTGWYIRTKDANVTGTKYTYEKATTGWVNSVSTSDGATAKWYEATAMGTEVTINGKKETPKPSSFTLIGDVEISKLDWTISNGKLNGKKLDIKAYDTKAQSITVSDELGADGKVVSGSELALPDGSDTLKGKTLTVKATNTKVSGNIKVGNEDNDPISTTKVKIKTYGSGTITLTNCTLEAPIDLPKGTVTLDNTTGSVAVTIGYCAASQGGTVTLNHGSSVSSVALYGPSTLNVYDTSNGGAVTVFGGSKADVPGNVGKTETAMSNPSWSGAKINLTTGGKVNTINKITAGGRNALDTNAVSLSGDVVDTTTHTIDGKTRANAGNIALTFANVTLNGAHASAINVKGGSVKMSNSATAAGITMGKTQTTETVSGKCSLDISGDGTTVSNTIWVKNVAVSDLTFKISGGKIKEVQLPDDYKAGGITGGSFTTAITKPAWLGNVTYQITTTETDYKNTYTNSFDDAFSAYTDGNGSTTVSIVGTDATSGKDVKFVLDNKTTSNGSSGGSDDVVVFSLKATAGDRILLPSKLGTRSVSVWYLDTTPYKAGEYFPVPENGATLKAVSSNADLGTINGVTAKVDGSTKPSNLVASLVGNTIKLSGAVDLGTSDRATLELTFTTTTNLEGLKVTATYFNSNPKQVLFISSDDDKLEITDGGKQISLKGGTTYFTVDCSGLTKMESIEVMTVSPKQTVTVSGTNLGDKEKKLIIAALEDVTFTMNNSAALNQAVNKALAGYTESSMNSAILAGQRAYAQETYKSTSSDIMKLDEVKAYNKLKLQVYLEIQVTKVTDYGVGTDGSVTLNITPKYHEVVSNGTDDVVNPSAKTLDASLLKSTDGAVEITLPSNWGFQIFTTGAQLYAHHGDYVYKVSNNKFTNLHGFSTFVIDANGPVASVDKIVRNGKVEKAASGASFDYDSMTKAVADVADGGVVTVNSGYKGTTSIPVSGGARQFTVNNSANAGTALTFTGANVTSDGKNDTYTVELTQDTAPTTATVSVGTATGGTGRASATSVVPGQSFTYTATPSSGYQASAPTARADNGATVSVVAAGTNQWTITVPAGAKTVTVTPAFVLTTGLPFTDVTDASAWYFNSVAYCYNTYATGTIRLMQGNSDGTFGIGRTLTRAQVAQMLYNLAGRPTVGAVAYPFHDVSNSSYYAYDAINWAARNGIAQGYGNGNFGPEDPVTREELVVFLWRYAESPTYNTNLYAYTDGGGVHSWAVPAMRWATGLNILSGTRSANLNGTISPFTPALREQVAVTVEKFHRLYG